MDRINSAMSEEQLACIKEGLAALKEAGKLWESHWEPILKGIGTASDWFMELNNVDVPKGKGYCASMAYWLKNDGKGYTKEGDPEENRKFGLDRREHFGSDRRRSVRLGRRGEIACQARRLR
jgi:hypothetical protein